MWLMAILFLVCLMLLVRSINEVVLRRRLRRRGVRTEGVVLSHYTEVKEAGTSVYAEISFVDAQGCSHMVTPLSSGVKKLPVGGRVPVLYLYGSPGTARVYVSYMRGVFEVGAPLVASLIFTVVLGVPVVEMVLPSGH